MEHYDEAKAFVLESITLCEKAKNRWGLGTAYRYLGLISLAEGQAAEAQTHFHESLDFFGEYTEGWDIALSLYYSAEAAMMEGDLAEARKSYLEALRISFGANSIPIAIDCLLGLARLYLQDGESTQVLELAYSILNHPSSSKETKDHAEQLYTGMTERLAKQDVKVAHETLASKSFEDIVKAVLASNCVDP